MNLDTGLSLGRFWEEISGLKPPRLVRDDPLEPLSVFMKSESVHVVLGACSCIYLRAGDITIVLSHIEAVKRSQKGGQRSYVIICRDISDSDIPKLVKFRLIFEDKEETA